MKKRIALLIVLCLFTLLLAGCGEKKTEEEPTIPVENDAAVVGTWSEPDFESGYVFNTDLTGRDTYWDLPFTYTAYNGVITITYEDEKYGQDRYSYTADETTLSMTRISDGGDAKAFSYTKQ